MACLFYLIEQGENLISQLCRLIDGDPVKPALSVCGKAVGAKTYQCASLGFS